MDLSVRSIVLLLLLACPVRSAVNHRGSRAPFNQPSKPPGLRPTVSGANESGSESNVGIGPSNESNHRLAGERSVQPIGESDGESNVGSDSGPEKPRSMNELESPKELPKESPEKSETIDRKNEGMKCEDHPDCAGCLSQANCVFCWYERQCVRHRPDYATENGGRERPKGDPNDNHHHSTPRGTTSELGALSERQAARLNNNTILIEPLGISRNTCSQRNTLSNVSASSCAVNEMTLLWLMFSSVILSVIVLFGCLFYCCVFRSKPADIIIIASDKDNFVLIDEE